MEIILWILQGLLGLMFATAGLMKATQSVDQLTKTGITWVSRLPLVTARLIGISEILGAIGLIGPWLTNVYPILTPVAACGLAIIMILAAFHHLEYNEGKAITVNTIIIILTGFVAYGRFVMYFS